jgi:hypothetical protein
MALKRGGSERQLGGAVVRRGGGDIPHRLDGVGEDDLLVRVSLLVVVTAVVNELHLLEHGGLKKGVRSCGWCW